MPPGRLPVGAGGGGGPSDLQSVGVGDGGVLPGMWDQVIGLRFYHENVFYIHS